MKKILISVFAFGTLIALGQQNVSTTSENKNVVLEEFTGIYCGYCPDGHVVANGIQDNNPGDVMLINIHTGGYATPQGGDPDFQTSFGASLATAANVSGYPTGSINRVGSAMSRSDWASSTTAVLNQSSPVNIWSEAIIDMGSGLLTVNVEIYYTGTQSVSTNKLNVAVLQNNVEGPQSGGSTYNPTAILSNGNYNHQHMLRHLMTGQWGDDITNVSQGTYETRSYNWTLPSDINGIDLDPTNLEVVVFIAEDQQNIITGDYSNTSIVFPYTTDAYYSDANCSNVVCGTDASPEITFKNYGNAPLTSLDIVYSINGSSSSNTHNWTGNLNSGASETITLPSLSFSALANNTVTISLSNPNGTTDQNLTNNDGTTTFMHYATAGQVAGGFESGTVSIDITTDAYGSETTWMLVADNGSVVASGGPYNNLSAAGTTVQPTESAIINQNECYTFVIEDSYGDGINGQYGAGGYTVTDNSGNIIAQNGSHLASMADFQSIDQENFETEAVSVSIEESNSRISIYPNPVKNMLTIKGQIESVEIYDAFGKFILTSNKNTINTTSLSNGIYIVNIKSNDLITTKRITVTK